MSAQSPARLNAEWQLGLDIDLGIRIAFDLPRNGFGFQDNGWIVHAGGPFVLTKFNVESELFLHVHHGVGIAIHRGAVFIARVQFQNHFHPDRHRPRHPAEHFGHGLHQRDFIIAAHGPMEQSFRFDVDRQHTGGRSIKRSQFSPPDIRRHIHIGHERPVTFRQPELQPGVVQQHGFRQILSEFRMQQIQVHHTLAGGPRIRRG
jgi:hypothetical protein